MIACLESEIELLVKFFSRGPGFNAKNSVTSFR